eukprot:scaffold111938_cov16-Tisochrysis_lutea.AAC.2
MDAGLHTADLTDKQGAKPWWTQQSGQIMIRAAHLPAPWDNLCQTQPRPLHQKMPVTLAEEK